MAKGISQKKNIAWAARPAEHHYAAAESYLSLIYPESRSAAYVKKLKGEPIVTFKAKDIF